MPNRHRWSSLSARSTRLAPVTLGFQGIDEDDLRRMRER